MYRFPLNEDENIVKKGHASLHRCGNAYTGALYLTNLRLVFVGYMMDIGRKYLEEILLINIKQVAGGKTFFVVPNTVNILIEDDEWQQFIVSGRDSWLAAINAELCQIASGAGVE